MLWHERVQGLFTSAERSIADSLEAQPVTPYTSPAGLCACSFVRSRCSLQLWSITTIHGRCAAAGFFDANKAVANLLFARVDNDKIFSGEFDEVVETPSMMDLMMGITEAEDPEVSTTYVQWRSFEIGFNDKKTKFIFVWRAGDSVLGQGFHLVAGDMQDSSGKR